jgi:hypothetical protein
MNVLVVQQTIPTLAIGLPDAANINSDGELVINSDQRVVFKALMYNSGAGLTTKAPQLRASNLSNASNLSALLEDQLPTSTLTSLTETKFLWKVAGVNVSWPGVSPLGNRETTYLFDGAFAYLQTASKYTLELFGTTLDGNVGQSTMVIYINSAPLGGSFSVCLQDANQGNKGCIKTGEAVTQEFRLLAAGWTDVELPIVYEFGYTVLPQVTRTAATGSELTMTTTPPPRNATNFSNLSAIVQDNSGPSEIWFEPVLDSVRDMVSVLFFSSRPVSLFFQ